MTGDQYVPPKAGAGEWVKLSLGQAGVDPDKLASAIAYAEAHESPWPDADRTRTLE